MTVMLVVMHLKRNLIYKVKKDERAEAVY